MVISTCLQYTGKGIIWSSLSEILLGVDRIWQILNLILTENSTNKRGCFKWTKSSSSLNINSSPSFCWACFWNCYKEMFLFINFPPTAVTAVNHSCFVAFCSCLHLAKRCLQDYFRFNRFTSGAVLGKLLKNPATSKLRFIVAKLQINYAYHTEASFPKSSLEN